MTSVRLIILLLLPKVMKPKNNFVLYGTESTTWKKCGMIWAANILTMANTVVPYETAKKLNAIGFCEPLNRYYTKRGVFITTIGHISPKAFSLPSLFDVLAPTYQEAADFLRKKSYCVGVIPMIDKDGIYFHVKVLYAPNFIEEHFEKRYAHFSTALKEGVDYLIEKLYEVR
nr:MAG TPA: hypothetical protein [Caudoviricetes sp.]